MLVIGLLCGCSLGLLFMLFLFYLKKISFQKLAQEIIQQADKEATESRIALQMQLKQKELEHNSALEKLSEQKMHKIALREEKLDRQLALIEKKVQEVEKKEKELAKVQQATEQKEKECVELHHELLSKLQSLAGVSQEEAKKQIVDNYYQEVKESCASYIFKQKQEMDTQLDMHAAALIATAMNRLLVPTVSEVAAIVVTLPSQEIKGRVIGREGRNIRVLEQETGVNVLIDDTPNAIVISGFDPIRKEVARVAIKELIQDGRIHPTRIEEVVAHSKERVQKSIKEFGEEAAMKGGVFTLHHEMILLLGILYFHYNHGQNVLAHSLEVSHLMGMMAAELNVDCEKAKRIGLLHDIGKAISHEMEGSHALIGQQIALQYGESEEIANGIGCHHEEIKPQTIEASLCTVANKISSIRPGARSEALEHYFKRSAKLEQLTRQFEGVEKAFAMHAGREVRVWIEPDRFDDTKAVNLARDIAKKIEKELSYYPGKIKITVIREKRVVEFAC